MEPTLKGSAQMEPTLKGSAQMEPTLKVSAQMEPTLKVGSIFDDITDGTAGLMLCNPSST